MTQKYFVMITNYGEGQLANAAALGIPLELKHMAVGDANDTEPLPNRTQTALINETYRAQINSLSVDENNPSQIIAEVVIPETIGGWFIREIGLYDTAGYLFAVANCPPSYKPQISEGSGRTQVIRLVLVVSSTDNITLKIDPAVVIATRNYVDAKVLVVSNALQAHIEADNPHLQYAKAANSQFLPWDAARQYRTGETCTQIIGGELKIWEMYAGPNLTCTGKNPSDATNRHDGWLLDDAPFWWIEYGNLPGRPSYWLAEAAPERAVMEMGQNLPITVYWRLARQYPQLVSSPAGTINTGDIRGEFLRVWDNARGIDELRLLSSGQYDSIQNITGTVGGVRSDPPAVVASGAFEFQSSAGNFNAGGGQLQNVDFDASRVVRTSEETRPRNIARAMIIEI